MRFAGSLLAQTRYALILRWSVLLAVFAALRTWRLVGRPIARFNDTLGYLDFDLFGSAARFWPITLPYQLLPNDPLRVAGHIVVATLAWGFLAWVLTEPLRGRHRWAPPLVLLVGLTDPASRFDLTILSESLGLSFAVAAFAGWVRLVRRSDWSSAAIALTTTTLFGMTRPAQVPLLALITVMVLAFWFLRAPDRFRGAVVAGLAAVSLVGFLRLDANQSMTDFNMYGVLANEVISDESTRLWFADRGMPLTEAITLSSGNQLLPREDLSPELAAFLDLPRSQPALALMVAGDLELAQWVRASGSSTYLAYRLGHPAETVGLLADRADFMLNPAPPDVYLLPLAVRPLIPGWVFAPWQWCVVAVFVSAAVVRSRRRDAATFVSLAAVGIGLPWFAMVALTGVAEPRHAVTLAVVLRVAAVAAVIGAVAVRSRLPERGAPEPVLITLQDSGS